MKELICHISKISIYLKKDEEKINEVVLFEPLKRNTSLNASQRIEQRKWTFIHPLSPLKRLSLKAQSFAYRHFPFLIPASRLSTETKLKTVIAFLLSQEGLREYFLEEEKLRTSFLTVLEEVAHLFGCRPFLVSTDDTALDICRYLTWIPEKNISLIDDLMELNVQMATLSREERNEILFSILSRVVRAPLHSVLEVTMGEETKTISLFTTYSKYTLFKKEKNQLYFSCEKDRTTASLPIAHSQGTADQRMVWDETQGALIGGYSGALNSYDHVLEQLFFFLGLQNEEVFLLNQLPQESRYEEKKILLVSLYGWNELQYIVDQNDAIRKLDQKFLQIGNKRYIKLNLLHQNITFNVLNNYPLPAETEAQLNDKNTLSLIAFTAEVGKREGWDFAPLEQVADRVEKIRALEEGTCDQFLAKQKLLLQAIDQFKEIRKELPALFPAQNPLVATLYQLLKKKNLKGIDTLIESHFLAEQLGYLQNRNCTDGVGRTASAQAIDKALYAYSSLLKAPFLPEGATTDEISLFKALYSMYLVWEEPEEGIAWSTGYMGGGGSALLFTEKP